MQTLNFNHETHVLFHVNQSVASCKRITYRIM